MAFSLNRAQVIGNLTRDPEVRQTSGGQMVASFGVATSSRWMDKASGQYQEKTEFHNIVVWGRLAEVAQQYLKKGRKVFVEGRLQTHDWESEEGVKRNRTEIIVENMILLDKAGAPTGEGDAAMDAPAPRYERKPNSSAVKAPTEPIVNVAEDAVTLDDLPF